MQASRTLWRGQPEVTSDSLSSPLRSCKKINLTLKICWHWHYDDKWIRHKEKSSISTKQVNLNQVLRCHQLTLVSLYLQTHQKRYHEVRPKYSKTGISHSIHFSLWLTKECAQNRWVDGYCVQMLTCCGATWKVATDATWTFGFIFQ